MNLYQTLKVYLERYGDVDARYDCVQDKLSQFVSDEEPLNTPVGLTSYEDDGVIVVHVPLFEREDGTDGNIYIFT